jgi:alanine-synthesizing transaminase
VFSSRVPADRQPNRLSRALTEARRSGELIDLTVSNPTRVGIPYPDDLLTGLANPAALDYAPAPFGLRAAREAVARDYDRRGIAIAPDRIVLTASTSEAYSLLFKLLCEPGGSGVLTPVPSYPLFEHLTRLDGVDQRRYALEYHGVWTIDFDDLDRQWSPATRAVLTVVRVTGPRSSWTKSSATTRCRMRWRSRARSRPPRASCSGSADCRRRSVCRRRSLDGSASRGPRRTWPKPSTVSN